MRVLMENDTYTKSLVDSVKFNLLHNGGAKPATWKLTNPFVSYLWPLDLKM